MAAYSQEQLDAVLKLLKEEREAEDEALARLLQGEGNRFKLRARPAQRIIIMDMDDDTGSDFEPTKPSSPKRKRASKKSGNSPKSPKKTKAAKPEPAPTESPVSESETRPTTARNVPKSPKKKRKARKTKSLGASQEDVGPENLSGHEISPFASNPNESSRSRVAKESVNIFSASRDSRDSITGSAISASKVNSSAVTQDRFAEQTDMGASVLNNEPKPVISTPKPSHHVQHNLPQQPSALITTRLAQRANYQARSVAYSTIIPNLSGVRTKNRRSSQNIKIISTSFAHPIEFKYSPPANGSKPCHWCHDFTYGLLGLGQRRVKVRERSDGNGYMELADGHVSRGKEPSRMCSSCTAERFRIIECATHTMQPIKELDERKFDFKAAFQTLFPDMRVGHCIKRNDWCAVCVSPAFHQCTAQHANGNGRGTVQDCGLLLCGTCVQIMNGCGGSMSQLVEARKKANASLRADVDFLFREGELYRRCNMSNLPAL